MFEGYNYVEKGGAPARRRFSDPAAVLAVYQKMTDDDMKAASRRLRIRKLYDGVLPYDPKALEACGLKNLTNVNFYGLKGTVDSRSDVILRLQSDTADLIELCPLAREVAGPDVARVGKVVTEAFSVMLRENGEFITTLARMNKEADLYGLGPVVWPNDMAYVPISLERAQVRFAKNCDVTSSKNELYMFESTLTADYLQSLRDNRELSASMGWQMDQVDEWFKAVFRDGAETRQDPASTGSTTPGESYQSLRRRDMFGEDNQFTEFHVIHVFVKEIAWPRGITHIVMPSTARTKFLYYKENAYRTMDECFLWFPFSVKERYAAEVRGIGSLMYAVERLKNRFLCQIFDSGFRAASFMMNTQAGSALPSQLTMTELGPYTMLPPGVTPSNSQVAPNFQQLAGVMQVLDSTGLAAVTGSDRRPLTTTMTKLFNGSHERITKAEQELQQAVESHRTEAEFAQRKSVIDRICRQCFLRALRLMLLPDFARVDYPEIGDFLRRCEMRNVTLDQIAMIPQYFSIGACRDLALGADGKVAELDAFYQQYAGELDEAGRRTVARKRAVLRFGVKDADEVIPELSRDQSPSDQSSFATLENNMMKQGMEAQVGGDQWHWSHIPVHAQVLQQIVDMVAAPQDSTPEMNEFNGSVEESQQIGEQVLGNLQDDPKHVLGILVMVSQHVQAHLEIGARQMGMEGQAKRVAKMLRDLRPTIKALNLAVATQERVEQAQREAQERGRQELERQASEAEIQKAQYKVDREAEVARYRVDKDHEVKMRQLELEASRAGRKADMDDETSLREQARRDEEHVQKMKAEQEMARAKVSAANAVGRMNAVQDATGVGSVRPSDVITAGPVNFTAP